MGSRDRSDGMEASSDAPQVDGPLTRVAKQRRLQRLTWLESRGPETLFLTTAVLSWVIRYKQHEMSLCQLDVP